MSVTSASPTRPARRGLRFTRRGRVVIVVAVVALLLAAFSIGRVSSRAAGPGPAHAAPAVVVVVQAGDTLWSIAKRVAPGADPRPLVTELERLNRLSSAALRPGQRLVLPSD